jgi:DNA-binding XRE family transcriptional regulator
MSNRIPGNYLRLHRRKAGLSQRELAELVGYEDPWAVSRHERSLTVPPLLIALAYQEVFQVPLSAIFSGIHSTVSQVIEKNLAALSDELGDRSGKGRSANGTAQKLEWLTQRRSKA